MKLLASQKDTLYDLIEKANLSPSQFELVESSSTIKAGEIATTVKFKSADFYFTFETGKNLSEPHYAIFSPGENNYVDQNYPGTWEYQKQYFFRWLNNLNREINSPNKWDRLTKEIEGITLNFENEEDKFSVSEFKILQENILSLKEGILTLSLLPEQVSAINNKLDHLTDLAKEMNKFDWKGLFIGTLISIIIQLSVTPENAKSLWDLVKKIFSNYLLP